MTSDRRRVLLAVILAVTVAMAGCAGALQNTSESDDVESDDEQMEADALQAEAIDAMSGVETVSVELEQTTETFGMEQSTNASGTIDVAAEEGELSMQLGSSGLGMLLPDSIETYVVDGTAYLNVGDKWVKTDVGNTSAWHDQQDQVDQQQEMLENGSLEIVDTTTFDGHEVYVVEVDLDNEQVKEMYGEQANGQFDAAESETDIEVSEMSATQYIDTESYYVRYTEVNVTVESDFGSTSTQLEMTLDDFNEEVDIELPDEAEGATDLSQWISGQGFDEWGDYGNESDWSWGDEESDGGLFGNESDWGWGDEESDGGLFGNESDWSWGDGESDGGLFGNESEWEFDLEFGNESSWGDFGFGNESSWGDLEFGNESSWSDFEFGNESSWGEIDLGNITEGGDLGLGNETDWGAVWEIVEDEFADDDETEDEDEQEAEDEAEAESA